MTSQPVARRIVGIEAIERERDAWRELARRRGRNGPFAGPGFVIAALKAYHGDDRPMLHVVERDERWQAVLPIVRRPLRRGRILVDEIGFPRNPHVIVNDPLHADDRATATMDLQALFRAMATERCSTLLLDHLPLEAGAPDLAVAVAGGLGYRSDDAEDSRTLCFATVQGSFDEYLATRSGDHRWQLKKILRKAAQAGLAVECLRSRSEIAEAFPTWFAIERASWQGATPGAAMTDEDRAFMHHLLGELDDDEVGELWLLRFAGEPAAALRMLGDGRRSCVHTMHYDQRFRQLTPGAIVLEAMLRSAWERGLSEVDLHGHSAFFQRWATDARPHRTVRLYKPGLYGRLLHGGRRLARRIDAWRTAEDARRAAKAAERTAA